MLELQMSISHSGPLCRLSIEEGHLFHDAIHTVVKSRPNVSSSLYKDLASRHKVSQSELGAQ